MHVISSFLRSASCSPTRLTELFDRSMTFQLLSSRRATMDPYQNQPLLPFVPGGVCRVRVSRASGLLAGYTVHLELSAPPGRTEPALFQSRLGERIYAT
jgi:hypothetical protein